MSIDRLASRLGKFLADNSPAILSGIAVTGVLTTAYLTGRASFQAARILEEEAIDLEPKEKVARVWKLYIPAAVTLTITTAAIVGANRIGTRRAAAMATAFTLSERAFENYREKVYERLGETKEQALRDEIAQDQVTANPPSQAKIFITGSGKVLCRDDFTGRYFESSMDALRKAEIDINLRVLNDGDASLTEFYQLLGLPSTSHSDEVGWNTDKPLKLDISATIAEDDTPCLCFIFRVAPYRDYYLGR